MSTWRTFRHRCLHPIKAGNKHQVRQLCQFSSSHLGSFMLPTQTILCEFQQEKGGNALPTASCNTTLSYIAYELKLLFSHD